MNDAPRIVHADPRFVVIDKPAGMLSVPGKGAEKQDCAAARVRTLFPHARGPLVVHRLDMETSGLMVFGLDEDAQRDLSGQFERREVAKQYVALLEGEVPLDSGVVELPVRADLARRPIQIVDHDHGRAALTRWRVLARETDRTRVLFEPLTGRTHQLRVHAAAGLHAPIIGDILYGPATRPPSRPATRSSTLPTRLMLHASLLSLRPPGQQRRFEFTSPPPF